jgi:hypothetical protein
MDLDPRNAFGCSRGRSAGLNSHSL